MRILIVPYGTVDDGAVRQAVGAAAGDLGCMAAAAAARPLPGEAWDATRCQCNSFVLLKQFLRDRGEGTDRVLGLVEFDLFIPMLTFVFGQAQFEGRAAVVSTARLRQRFYGLPDDDQVFAARLRKEVAHELGHTFGLVHCGDADCVMSLANTILHVDRKQERYCAACRSLLGEKIPELRKREDEGKLAHPRS